MLGIVVASLFCLCAMILDVYSVYGHFYTVL